MITKEIQKVLNKFNDENRFYKKETESATWIYDSYTHDIYPFDKRLVLNTVKNQKRIISNYLKSQPLQEIANLFYVLAKINMCNQDSFILEEKSNVANVMINTSHRCNLNCSYCYRDKNNVRVNNIENIKKSINFVMNKYKPEAPGYIFTYSMTSESSVDIKILEQILEAYPQIEAQQYKREDIKEESAEKFYRVLAKDFRIEKKSEPDNIESMIDKIVQLLNSLIEDKNLYDNLNMTEESFNENDIEDVWNRTTISRWRLLRLNRSIIERKYKYFINSRTIPWLTFCFFTNGTCVTDEYLSLLKRINVKTLNISLDGPEEVHDKNRKYHDLSGSYKNIVKNIKVFLREGYDLSCSTVITPFFPKPLEIALHVKELGFKSLAMVPVRYGSVNSFNDVTINDLINGYGALFKRFEQDLLNQDYELLTLLKDDMCITSIITFLDKTKRVQRCEIDNQLVIDTDGKIYGCLYNCNEQSECIGSIEDEKISSFEDFPLLVSERIPCNTCWARYLCGGTCYYTTKKENSVYNMRNSIECKLKKYLCERSIELIIFMKENGINPIEVYNNIV